MSWRRGLRWVVTFALALPLPAACGDLGLFWLAGRPATGRVVGFTSADAGRPARGARPARAHVRFAAEGREHETLTWVAWDPPAYRPGEEVAVRYLPGRPEAARVLSFSEYGPVFGFAGLALVVAALLKPARRESAEERQVAETWEQAKAGAGGRNPRPRVEPGEMPTGEPPMSDPEAEAQGDYLAYEAARRAEQDLGAPPPRRAPPPPRWVYRVALGLALLLGGFGALILVGLALGWWRAG